MSQLGTAGFFSKKYFRGENQDFLKLRGCDLKMFFLELIIAHLMGGGGGGGGQFPACSARTKMHY